MNKVYTDGSYDAATRLGAYCIVIVPHAGRPDWYVEEFDGGFSTDVETAGLREAIKVAHNLSMSNQRQSVVFCDSTTAIQKLKTLAYNNGVQLRHIFGHVIHQDGVVLNDDAKRQHWSDVMDRHALTYRIKHKLDSE